jgi:hypothetical protein
LNKLICLFVNHAVIFYLFVIYHIVEFQFIFAHSLSFFQLFISDAALYFAQLAMIVITNYSLFCSYTASCLNALGSVSVFLPILILLSVWTQRTWVDFSNFAGSVLAQRLAKTHFY